MTLRLICNGYPATLAQIYDRTARLIASCKLKVRPELKLLIASRNRSPRRRPWSQ